MDNLMKKNIFSCAIAGAAALALSAAIVAPASAAEAHKPKIALVMKSLANEFFLTMENGAKEYQKQNADKFTLVSNGIKNETDTASQIQIVEQMIVSKADAIIIAPSDSRALVPVVKKAIDSGILVINIDNKFDDAVLKDKNLNVPFVGPNNRKGAKAIGDYLAKHLQKGDEVGIIEGIPTSTNSQQRTQGFQDAMAEGGMKVVSVQSGQWEMNNANAIAAAMLSEYPNIKALLADNDNMALGAVSAIRAAGKRGQVQVVGYDNIAAIKPMLQDGRVLATADQYASKQAVFGIDTALEALKDGKKQSELKGSVETPVQLIVKQ
ncbi:sugar ABC transporter substrate-binding protein [Pluralibacter gergoviae]|uniref:Sugar ABC transporter substrate-binding protein n=2 Tax=Pluralibacter gergoviae TaxID=61647 RepID=A0A0J5K3N8_PLUGE|nr:sugar ABC transporter substrate-binding protein [Pluralibacter gergoviae]KMK01443.1 sugar ABC transporter substrate-binding protein [Pluralibacter gergoviae]KMK07744.1 sugar ABC transporter substrate-binding protein [Pluralibacter gergoviae]KMK11105.1 sugar ABC transporter substrate-binding protein [Pluralibacter gergoviae]KMK20860.1 sugar ABC transporter substrate-binding protein [Pluralibacter gergoviae]